MNDEACNTDLELRIGGCYNTPEKEGRKSLPFPHHSNHCRSSTNDHGSSSSLIIISGDEDEESKNISPNGCEADIEDHPENQGRKKLRLSRSQTSLLEDSFKLHNTLNMAQKVDLSEKLNLKPRQVEVWFQNRRARTKSKQIESEFELLRENFIRLKDENQRLKKELSELRRAAGAAAN